MRSISKVAAVAAFVSIASAGNAPIVTGNPIEITYSATILEKQAGDLSGAMKIAAAPNGQGVNIQFSLYNLPASNGNLSYGLYTGNVAAGMDCSNTGSMLNPYGGITGPKCYTDKAACAIGDLSDAYGGIQISDGGSGTGYFAANYLDKYLSMQKGDQSFVGQGSVVVKDASGGYVACANLVNNEDAGPQSKKAAHMATKTTAMASASGSGSANGGGNGNGNGAGSSSTSPGAAPRTAAPLIGAGVLGLAALIF